MQIEVDNEILAAVIDAHFGVKHKVSLNSEKKISVRVFLYLRINAIQKC